MLITFEGIDGCGKTTQLQLLKKRLEDERRIVSSFREPGGTELSEKVRELLLGVGNEMDPVTELLLFSAARSELISRVVKPLLDKDHIILLDRFYDSTIAYQGFGRASLEIDHIFHLNRVASHGLVPDATFYFRVSLEQAEQRRKDTQNDRMEEAGRDFYRRVIEGFEYLVTEENRVIPIQADRSVYDIHKDVWGFVQKMLV